MQKGNDVLKKDNGNREYLISWGWAMEHVYPLLCNYERIKDKLDDFVYLPFLDLVILFYIRLEDGGGMIKITPQILSEWRISDEILKKQAIQNLKNEDYESLIASKIIADMINGESRGKNKTGMAILTNRDRSLGAAGILYSTLLKEYSDWMGTDLFLLPSSIHEFILLPDNGCFTVRELKQMVKEVNQECVSPKEYLADRVYHFSRDNNEVSIAA